jgi:hypothetical protein
MFNYHVYKHYKGLVYFNDTYRLLFIALFDDFNLITSIFHCLCPSFYLYLSNLGFVDVNNWKNSENSSISQLCFLFVIYLKFIITLVKGMFDLQIDKKKKQKTKNCLIFFCLTRPQFVPTIYHTRGEHANHYATDAVPYFYFIFINFLIKISYCKIFYMWMFCIKLKERNTKRFVQNWHSPSHLRQNGHDFA